MIPKNKTTTTTLDSMRASSIYGITVQQRRQINNGETLITFKYGKRLDISMKCPGIYNIEKQK